MLRESARDTAPLLPLLLTATFIASAGCSGGETEAAPEADARRAGVSMPASAGTPALEPDAIELIAPARERTRSEVLADAYDPEADEWESEALSVGLMRRLEALGALLSAEDAPTAAATGSLVAQDFRCDALVPAELEDVRAGDPLHLRRWRGASEPAADAPHRGAEGLAAALNELRAVLHARPARVEVGTEFQVIGLTRHGDEIAAHVLYSAWGHTDEGSAQQEAGWLCRFEIGEGSEDPRFARIALDAYQDGRLAGRRTIFADATASVLGADATFEAQVVAGIDHWLPRISQLQGMTNIGHHGLALGDVDGDGLEDLYVCDDGGLPNRLYKQEADGTLRDISAEAGVDFLDHSSSALLLDLDGDGDQDLVVAMRGLLLFAQNNGDGRFISRVRIPIGIGSMSLSAADYDNDGDLDVYCCMYNAHPDSEGIAFPYNRAENGSENILLRNAGGFRFVDATEETGLSVNNNRFSFAAVWEDYDDDGDQDLYVANDFGLNNLYRNDGGHFTDVAVEAGVEDIASGMSATWGDIDRDGHPDIYVGNLYSPAGMRVTANEPFNAGKTLDTVMDVRRMARGNTLYVAKGDGSFHDRSVEAGVNRGRWAWAAPFIDIDGDGWEDLVVANGYYTFPDPRDLDSFFWRHVVHRSPTASPSQREIKAYMDWWLAMTHLVKRQRSYNGNERNCAFLNLGDGTFADISALSGVDFPEDARSIVVTDWDGDGDLDLWVRNRTGPRLRLMLNQIGPAHGQGAFTAFLLRGTSANRDAIGARVELELEGAAHLPLRRSLQAGTGFLGQSSKWLHFGLERDARIAAVHVRWPGGELESFSGVETGKRYSLVQESGQAIEWQRPGGAARIVPAPSPAARETQLASVFLPARFPCPILRFIPAGEEHPRELDTSSGPLLVFLWSPASEAALNALEELVRRAPELRASGLEVLVLDTSAVARTQGSASAAELARGRLIVEEAGFPFQSGRATGELLDKLAVAQEFLFDILPGLYVPMSILIDGQARIAAIHRGGPEVDTLLLQVGALDASVERRHELALPLGGHWKIMALDVDLMTAANWFVERHPEDSERYYERAIQGEDAGPLAMSGLSDARLDPERARAQARLARLRLSQGRSEEAIVLLRLSIELDSTNAEALNDLADAELGRGEFDAAIEHYGRAIAHDPRLIGAHYGLGNALRRTGRRDEAMQAWQRALELDPVHPETNNNLGIAWFEQQELDEAAACFERAIAGNASFASGHYLLGAVRAAQGQRTEATASYRRGIELDPKSAEVHLGRGEGHLAEGRLQEAVDHFELLIELRPESARAWFGRAQVRARRAEHEAAREDARRAAELATEPELRARIAQFIEELE